jgi:hypothetical protein
MQDMQPDNMNQAPIGSHGESDREGAMAKADLYKLANYSLKLFKKLDDDAQLEGWVQAKITKAADYIASVFHYLEYEMEFSDYGARLDNNEMYNESQKLELKNKLMEAKAKVAELKKLQAGKKAKEEKVKEGFDEKSKVGDTYKTSAGNTVTKTATGLKHERPASSYSDEDGDDKSGKGKKSHAKAQSAAEKKERAPAQKQSKTGTWGMKDGAKFDNRKTNEGAKPDFADLDKDGDEKEPMKKAAKEAKKEKKVDEASNEKCNHTAKGEKCPVHGMKECAMYEGQPSAGMTKKEKSAVVKDAKAGKDIGKPGKSFDKVAKAAGGGEKGKKIAAAAMWKNKAKSLKESLQALLPEEQLNEEDQAQAQAGLQALLDYAKQNDPQGLAQAVQQGGQAVENYFKSLADKMPANPTAGPTAGPTSPTEPKDMPGSGDVEAEEGVGMDIANAATFGLAKPIVQGAQVVAQNPGAFVQGAANQAGREVGNVVNTVQGAVQGAQKVGSDIIQGVSNVANAAKQGYNSARSNTMPPDLTKMGPSGIPATDPKGANTPNSAMAPKVGIPRAVQADARKEDNFQTKVAQTSAQLRESDELGRMKQFLTRLNG